MFVVIGKIIVGLFAWIGISGLSIWGFNLLATNLNKYIEPVIENPDVFSLIAFLIYIATNVFFTAPVVIGTFFIILFVITSTRMT